MEMQGTLAKFAASREYGLFHIYDHTIPNSSFIRFQPTAVGWNSGNSACRKETKLGFENLFSDFSPYPL